MKLNLKSTIAAPTSNKSLNGIIGNTRRGIVVDKTLDTNSNNPVANKPVSTALAALAGKVDAALQKPTGLTKTKLVGVGAQGQENIEIGDNLTLANGKLAATGGGSNVNILVGSTPEQVDNVYGGTYSGIPDESKINILHIPNFADFVITFSSDGGYTGYVNAGGTKFIIFLAEGEYQLEVESESSENPINTINLDYKTNTYTGTILSDKPTYIHGKNNQIVYSGRMTTQGHFGYSYIFDDEACTVLSYIFTEYGNNKVFGSTEIHLQKKTYTHFVTLTNSSSNIVLYLTIQNTSEILFTDISLPSYLYGKKVLANGNIHGVVPTYITKEGDIIKMYYRTPGDSNINPNPDEFDDLSSFTVEDQVTPVVE